MKNLELFKIKNLLLHLQDNANNQKLTVKLTQTALDKINKLIKECDNEKFELLFKIEAIFIQNKIDMKDYEPCLNSMINRELRKFYSLLENTSIGSRLIIDQLLEQV